MILFVVRPLYKPIQNVKHIFSPDLFCKIFQSSAPAQAPGPSFEHNIFDHGPFYGARLMNGTKKKERICRFSGLMIDSEKIDDRPF